MVRLEQAALLSYTIEFCALHTHFSKTVLFYPTGLLQKTELCMWVPKDSQTLKKSGSTIRFSGHAAKIQIIQLWNLFLGLWDISSSNNGPHRIWGILSSSPLSKFGINRNLYSKNYIGFAQIQKIILKVNW